MAELLGGCMHRRDFINVIATATLAWPIAARAQQANQVRRIGVLIGYSGNDSETQARLLAFREALENSGWTEGSNVRIDYRFAPTGPDQARLFARELIALRPDVLVSNSTPATAALLREAPTIPIVFAGVSDPMGSGFVSSIARPGGNITGFTDFEPSMMGKWLQTLKEIAPRIERVAVIFNPKTAPGAGTFFLGPFESMARSFVVKPIAVPTNNEMEIESALEAIGREPGGSLIVMPDAFLTVHRKLIIGLAAQHRIPTIYPYRYQAIEGGLISYGIDTADLLRRAASYVVRVLKGEKAGDLPVQAPVKFELVLNTTTAKALGLTVPPRLLARADTVVE
jgi:putative ABC transport system substrate-binding protein